MSTSLRFTTRDLECLPDIDGVRYEIIDGELYVSKALGWHHQYTTGQVFSSLNTWSQRTGSGVALLTLLWRLPKLLGRLPIRSAWDIAPEAAESGSMPVASDLKMARRQSSVSSTLSIW